MAINIQIRDTADTQDALMGIVKALADAGRWDKATLIAYETGLRDGGLAHLSAETAKKEATVEILCLIAANCGVNVGRLP